MNEIRWAPRVAPDKIWQLYQSDAMGMLDERLLDAVGYAFLARAQSIIDTNRIHLERIALCPSCGKPVHEENERFECPCGWSMAAQALHQTYKGRQLIGPSIVGFAEAFIRDWNRALDDPHRRMMAIDDLIHRFHWEMIGEPTRPVAVNYIKGKMGEIKRLIWALAGQAMSGERAENMLRWQQNNQKAAEIWGPDKQ